MEYLGINVVNKSELVGLNGIGNKLADRLITSRGIAPFKSDEDIINVKGIGPTSLENIESRSGIAFTFETLTHFLNTPLLERNDSRGMGHYGASRSRGRPHRGIDILCTPGQTIYAPISGKIRLGYVYPDNRNFTLIEITGSGRDELHAVKLFYTELAFNVLEGHFVSRAQKIGVAQAISDRWGPDMEDHVHVELRLEAVQVDPTDYVLGRPWTA